MSKNKLVLIVVIVLAVSLAGVFFINQINSKQNQVKSNQQAQEQEKTELTLLTYTNPDYPDFSFQYPSDWELKDEANQTEDGYGLSKLTLSKDNDELVFNFLKVGDKGSFATPAKTKDVIKEDFYNSIVRVKQDHGYNYLSTDYLYYKNDNHLNSELDECKKQNGDEDCENAEILYRPNAFYTKISSSSQYYYDLKTAQLSVAFYGVNYQEADKIIKTMQTVTQETLDQNYEFEYSDLLNSGWKEYTNSYYPDLKIIHPSDWEVTTQAEKSEVAGYSNRRITISKTYSNNANRKSYNINILLVPAKSNNMEYVKGIKIKRNPEFQKNNHFSTGGAGEGSAWDEEDGHEHFAGGFANNLLNAKNCQLLAGNVEYIAECSFYTVDAYDSSEPKTNEYYQELMSQYGGLDSYGTLKTTFEEQGFIGFYSIMSGIGSEGITGVEEADIANQGGQVVNKILKYSSF